MKPLNHDVGFDLGRHESKVASAFDLIKGSDITKRVWAKDYTVWDPNPKEIINRLGWLNVIDTMRKETNHIENFAKHIRNLGFKHVVLIGMGGSSLGPEVLRQVIGPSDNFPNLIVLDSTLPGQIKSVTDTIDTTKTLFIISSKSGGTIETLSLYKYFRWQIERIVESENAGKHFVAITDAGTHLEKIAKENNFLHIFLNPEDVGGRFSVLSLFGLVPAALTGVDIGRLTNQGHSMQLKCSPETPETENPGLWLGIVLGILALEGSDKLTLFTSPTIESFGLWVEQLIAESICKEGKGIIPIAGEPLVGCNYYSEDRFFVFIRLRGDKNDALDKTMDVVARHGHPWIRLDIDDIYGLGSEFYRWEFAASIAGSILRVHPFNQPNVQLSKDMTAAVLSERATSGKLDDFNSDYSLLDLMSQAKQGKYLAIMAYVPQTPAMDRALTQLRQRILVKHRIPVTLGYGPRFLHSTGQMHKAGPDKGLFLQITAAQDYDVDIPGEDFTFGILTQAQAIGDLRALRSFNRPVSSINLVSGGKEAYNTIAHLPI